MSPRLTPCKRDDFIGRLKALGFEGPVSGSKHSFMVYGKRRQTIPSDAEYSVDLVRRLLREVGDVMGRPISRAEWTNLGRKRQIPDKH